MLFLLTATQLYAIVPTAYITQTQYRWRNNDGNETSATWKAAANTAITVSDTATVLRLRIELNNNSGAGNYDVNESLEYSSNGGASWTTMTNAPSNAFKYVSSTLVTNGGATTNQMGSATSGTFVAGRIISAVPSGTPMSLGANKTEYEWVIKPSANILPLSTYTFRSANQGSTPTVYPTLTTTCVGVYVLTVKDSSRCGPGTVQLKATGSGSTTLKWYADASGGTALATGNAFTTPLLTTSTTYYVAASSGTCESPRSAVHANINPLPVVNLGSDITVCQGNSATFNAGTFTAYSWDNGSTGPTRTVNVPGSYYVTVTGAGGCKGSDTVQLLNYPRPVVNLGNDTFICPGVSLTLNAGNPGMTYLWDNATTAQTRTVTTGGDYSVTVTNEHGCTGTDNILVGIKDLPGGTLGAIHGNPATYTFKVLDPLFAVGYTWDFGDGTPTASGQMVQHTYMANGVYLVKLKLQGDCGTNAERSRTVDVYDAGGTTGISGVGAELALRIYPNPAREKVVVEAGSGSELRHIRVFNAIGQEISSMKAVNSSRMEVSTRALATGYYLLQVETGKGSFTRRLEVINP